MKEGGTIKKTFFTFFFLFRQKMKSLLLLLLLEMPLAYSEYIFYPINVERKFNEASNEWKVVITNTMHHPLIASVGEDLSMEGDWFILESNKPLYLTIPESEKNRKYNFHAFGGNEYSKNPNIIDAKFVTDPIEILKECIHMLESVCIRGLYTKSIQERIDILKEFYAIAIWTVEEIQTRSDNLEGERDRFTAMLESHGHMPGKCLSQIMRESKEHHDMKRDLKKILDFVKEERFFLCEEGNEQ